MFRVLNSGLSAHARDWGVVEDKIESLEMRMTSDNWRDPISFGKTVCTLFGEEISCRRQKGLDHARLLRYYHELFGIDGQPLEISAFAYVQRLWPLVEILRASPRPLRVLDAGCGFGTEAYLTALMGHSVLGVELVPERAELARSRFDFFASKTGQPLHADFVCANIFELLADTEKFDVIWAMEAISHIYPQEKFLSLARKALCDGGRLIISDPNRLNPKSLWRSIRIRGSLVHRPHNRFRDPKTGQPVDYGQEQIISPYTLSRALKRTGYDVISISMSGFMATTVLPARLLANPRIERILKQFPSVMQRIPLLRNLGSIYTLVAAPAAPGFPPRIDREP
jgi:SAM-dependent methyltransferase